MRFICSADPSLPVEATVAFGTDSLSAVPAPVATAAASRPSPPRTQSVIDPAPAADQADHSMLWLLLLPLPLPPFTLSVT